MVSKVFITAILLVAIMLGLISNAFARVVEVDRERIRFREGGSGFRHGDFGFRHGDFGFRHRDFGFRRDDFGFRRDGFATGFELGALAASNTLGTIGSFGVGIGPTVVVPGTAVVAPGTAIVVA